MSNIYNELKTDYNKTVFNYCATKWEFVASIKILGGYIMKKKIVSVMMTAIMVLTLAACGDSGAASVDSGAPAADSGAKTETASSTETVATATPVDSVLAVGTYDPASAGDIEIGFGWWGNQVRDEVTKNAMDYFHEVYPNVTFNLNAQTWNDYWAQMQTFAASDMLPDLMQQDYAFIEQWVEAGNLLDLTPYVESGALDLSNLSPSIVDTGRSSSDGHIYAVCAGENAPSLLYNKTLTDSLGITVPDNMTWDQFAELSRKIYAESGYGVIYGNTNSENPLTYYARGLGHQAFFEADGLSTSVEEMTGYYQRLLDGVSEGWMYDTNKIANVSEATIPEYPLVYGTDPSVRTWVAFAFSNQLSAYQAAAEADGIELGITSWPENNPTQANYLKPGQFFSITTDTKNPDLAVAILNYLINDTQGGILLQAERGVPASTKVAADIAEEVGKKDPTYPVIVKYLEFVAGNSSNIFPSLPGYAGTVNDDAIKPTADEILDPNPGLTAEEAAKKLVDGAAKIAADY